MDETKVVLTRDDAARCAGLSERRVAYWATRGVVAPSIETKLDGGRIVRLYEFTDLMSLLVAARLHEHGASLDDIRETIANLRRSGYEGAQYEPLRAAIREAAKREPGSVGQIERRRGVMGGKPRIGGTRVPVDTVRRHLEFGRTDSEILDSYPQLEPADIDAVRAAVSPPW